MPILKFRAAAFRDLAAIASYIGQESGSSAVAASVAEKVIAHCERISALSIPIGRPRPELRSGYRSVTFGNYVIFMRYTDEDAPRSHIYISNIIHGRRDLAAYFAANPAGDG